MIRRLGVLALVGLTATACASARFGALNPAAPPKTPPPKTYLGARCAPTEPCAPKEKSAERQYFDVHHRRYYYYDPVKRAYFWEDGEPRT
jgi:hypothetical protein